MRCLCGDRVRTSARRVLVLGGCWPRERRSGAAHRRDAGTPRRRGGSSQPLMFLEVAPQHEPREKTLGARPELQRFRSVDTRARTSTNRRGGACPSPARRLKILMLPEPTMLHVANTSCRSAPWFTPSSSFSLWRGQTPFPHAPPFPLPPPPRDAPGPQASALRKASLGYLTRPTD